MAVTITIGGKTGVESAQPFSIRDPQPGLAAPDRPVWILADTYPRIAGVPGRAGRRPRTTRPSTSARSRRGRAGRGLEVGAVKAGAYKLRYRIDAGLSGQQEAVNADGGGPSVGSFAIRIASKPELTRINSRGGGRPVGSGAGGGGSGAATGGGGNGGSANGGSPNATSGAASGGSGAYPLAVPPSGSGN